MKVVSLHRYPIKGCQGESVDSVLIDHLGVVGDRRLMLVDDTGRFLSQRADPVLATIVPTLERDLLSVTAAAAEPLSMVLDPDGATLEVSIWQDAVTATDQGDDAAAWFSAVVGRPVRLVWFTRSSKRLIDKKFSPRPDAETAFTDGYPLLVVTEESLGDLNTRLSAPVGIDRFRPNLVLSGSEAWQEDRWSELAIGGSLFDVVKPCARCLVPTTDQVTGKQHPEQEPLRTLATFRTNKPFGAIFGQNVVPRSHGTVATGELVSATFHDK